MNVLKLNSQIPYSQLRSFIPDRKLVAETDVIIITYIVHWVFVYKHEMHITGFSNAT